MQIEPSISFQNLARSDAIEQAIMERIDELEQFHPRLIGCRVVVDAPHRGKHRGRIYEVRIDLSVPGKDIAVTREAGTDHAHEDIYVAIRDSFDAARRQLEDQIRKTSGHRSKRHPESQHGKIVRIFDQDGYGFIETADGHEVYFDRDSMTKPSWPKVQVGSQVRFKELDGDKGPYGIQVTLLSAANN
ncbi:MAG: HPF/RaiA family ribosome-associated protein [Rhizobiales bacterium]|nr:HPF/RaiA family ribosome-associated protein [Hyphomicrobiales bacterium]